MNDLIKRIILELDSNSEAVKNIARILTAALCLVCLLWLLIYSPAIFTLLVIGSIIGVWIEWEDIVKWAKNNANTKNVKDKA